MRYMKQGKTKHLKQDRMKQEQDETPETWQRKMDETPETR